MNGFIHGVVFVNGFAYYKIMLIVADVILGAAISLVFVKLGKKIYKLKKEEE